VLVFLILHKYAYNYEKSKVIQSTTIELQKNVTQFSIDFFEAHQQNDSITEDHFKEQFREMASDIEQNISKPLEIENAVIVVKNLNSNKIVYSNSTNEITFEYSTPISCAFISPVSGKLTHYICYYEIPDFKYLILAHLQLAMILTITLIVLLIVVFVFIIRRWIWGVKESKLKDDFFQNITHELKTPIATTSIATDIFKKFNYELPPEKIKTYINIIVDENRKMKQIVDDLLSISVVEKGKSKMINEEVDIHDMLKKTLKNFQFVVEERGGKLISELNATQSFVVGDSSFINMIFTNLIDNAIKYSKDAPIINITTWSNQIGVSISVKDNGIGIPSDSLNKIFNKTYRIKNNHDVKGFGLGLYFVKQLVDLHHGEINVKSTLDKGTEFIVYLPFGKIK
jgi:two-component system phosphate regulon sensor histidine kinase PhoR